MNKIVIRMISSCLSWEENDEFIIENEDEVSYYFTDVFGNWVRIQKSVEEIEYITKGAI